MYELAIANQKGGVGKTATTINLGAALAEYGRRVLVVDFDPQGHATDALGLSEAKEPATLKRALLGEWEGELAELITPYRENLDVIATNLDMFLLEPMMYGGGVRNREFRLRRLLEAFAPAYDYCLIDCPPSLGALTDNGIIATARRDRTDPVQGGVLIPVQAEDSSLKALKLLLQQISSIETEMEVVVELVGLVINQYDSRRGTIATSSRDAFLGIGIPVVGEIGDRTAVRQVWRRHTPVLEHDPESTTAAAYKTLAENVIRRFEGAAA